MKLKDKFVRLSQKNRLYGINIPIIGLTGGIATGKSTVANLLTEQGLPLIDADQLVKSIYQKQETIEFIKSEFPDVWINNEMYFPLLRKKVFNNPEIKKQIENYIYQRLPQAFQDAFKEYKDPSIIIYDVPLLFEKKMENFFDINFLVYAPKEIQKQRLIERDGKLESMADEILNQQMDIEDKRDKADFVIDNSGTKEELAVEVKKAVSNLLDF